MITLPMFITCIIIFILGLIIGHFTYNTDELKAALHLAEAEREELLERRADAVEQAVRSAEAVAERNCTEGRADAIDQAVRSAEAVADKNCTAGRAEAIDLAIESCEAKCTKEKDEAMQWCCSTGQRPTGCEHALDLPSR